MREEYEESSGNSLGESHYLTEFRGKENVGKKYMYRNYKDKMSTSIFFQSHSQNYMKKVEIKFFLDDLKK